MDRFRNRLARLAKNGTAKSVVFALCLRSLAQFGMTPAEPVPQLNPCDCTTKEVSVTAEKYSSLRADECRRGNPVKNAAPPCCHAELVSASIQSWKLSVTLARSRNRLARLAKNGTAKSVVFALCLRSLAQFGMTPAEPVPQLNPCDCTTKEVSVTAEKYSSLRADECRRGNPVKNAAPPCCHAELVSASIQSWKLSVTLARSRNRLARLAKNGTAKSVVFALCLRSLAQFGMTPAEPVLCLVNRMSKKCAFTMAEILLFLTITCY